MGKTIKKKKDKDPNIQKAFTDELDLTTRTIKSKKAYTRKQKYKQF